MPFQNVNYNTPRRQMNPTILQNGKSNQTPRTAVKRGHETFNAAMAIHEGTGRNACPAIEGMFVQKEQARTDDQTCF